MPAAHAANANLFVSAELSQFDNYMSGPQVIEVVIIDSDINDTDEAKGEPDVTVNGKILRMVQAVDGNWYGYFADKTQAFIADGTVTTTENVGLNFGHFCKEDSTIFSDDDTALFRDTVGIAVAGDVAGGINGAAGEDALASCTALTTTVNGTAAQNVVREAKDINTQSLTSNIGIGQIGLASADIWPIIQLYDLNPTGNVVIQYNKGGGVQSTTLTFDAVDQYAGADFDRTVYPNGAQVHLTVTDPWLNIDPTDEDSWTFGTVNGTTHYQVFDENGREAGAGVSNGIIDISNSLGDLMTEGNAILLVDINAQGAPNNVLTLQDNDDSAITCTVPQNAATCATSSTAAGLGAGTQPVTITEQGPNSGVFASYDDYDISVLKITNDAKRGTSATINYNNSPVVVLVQFDSATIDIQPADDIWNSGEEIPIVIVDGDQNKNSRVDEDLDLNNPDVTVIPSLTTGDPFTLGEASDTLTIAMFGVDVVNSGSLTNVQAQGISNGHVDPFSQRLIIETDTLTNTKSILIDFDTTLSELQQSINSGSDFTGYNLFHYDIRGLTTENGMTDIYLFIADDHILNNDGASGTGTVIPLVDGGDPQGYLAITDTDTAMFDETLGSSNIGLVIEFNTPIQVNGKHPIVADFFSFGFTDDGVQSGERVANQIIRIEAEETGFNTGTFAGSLEYVMINQLNVDDVNTYTGITPIADDPSFIVIEDLTDEDSPRVSYNDLGRDGVITPISDQQEAPSHSGVVSLNQDSYKIADTVVITLEDADLNVYSSFREIYTVVTSVGDVDNDQVGHDVDGNLETLSFGSLGRLLDVTFDDIKWENTGDGCDASYDDGLGATGFSLIETGTETGIFVGDFQIPKDWCRADYGIPETTIGLDIEVNYVDFRDASGDIIEVSDSAGVRANTGSVSLDRTVYPVPFGGADDPSNFALHSSAGSDQYLNQGDLSVHIRVNDLDFDLNPAGEDNIAEATPPITVSIHRGSASVEIAAVGNSAYPIGEIAPDAGIFEYDLTIQYNDGPAEGCPSVFNGTGCILTGDILRVHYTDPADASGDPNTVTDAATFYLRNGVLQSDQPVYIIGSDMILTLIEPDFDLDNDSTETYDLDLIEWDSDAATLSMGEGGGTKSNNGAAFDPEPTTFRETGDSTGIFQVAIEIPQTLDGDPLERGEEIVLEYTDWGSSGSDYVGQNDVDVNLIIYTSNFGATIELDQQVYTWTDKVYITIVAQDHNFDVDSVDAIGDSVDYPIRVSTTGATLDNYKFVETGADTGIFTGEVILTGFQHNADGDITTGDDNGNDITSSNATGRGPVDGLLPTGHNDRLTVSFEFSEDETVVGSALIRWNIGDVQWLEASYPASGTGIVRVIDPDMNLDPEIFDNFDVDVWSDSDGEGIDLTVIETNEATGIFDGTVFFTVDDESSGHRLRVAEGDTVTAEYEDNTLPDPYMTSDELSITAKSRIGTVVPPLGSPAAHPQTNTPPTFTESSLPDLTLEATGPQTDIRPTLLLNIPAATDADGGSLTPTHNADTSYGIGTHTITWTATDSEGLTATLTQRIIVQDTIRPTFTQTSLPDVTIEATNQQTDVRPSLNANPPIATDFVDQSVDVTHNAQTSYEVGTHTITWTATDDAGLTDTITQNVIVTQAPPPTFTQTSLPDITLEATGPLTDTPPLTPPTATDADGGSLTPTHNANPSYGIGTHTITWVATDADGLTATLTQRIIVQDTTAPTFDVSSLPDLTIKAAGPQTDIRPHLTAPTATDIADQSVDITHNANPSYGPGEYTITWTATDDAGLVDTLTQNIRVTDAQIIRTNEPQTSTSVDENQLLAIQLVASASDHTFTTNSTIPNALDPNTGLFQWTPSYTDAGVYPVTFTATNATNTESTTVEITVNNVNRPVQFQTLPTDIINEGESLTLRINGTISDPDTDDTHAFTGCTEERDDITCTISASNDQAVLTHDGSNVRTNIPFTVSIEVQEDTHDGPLSHTHDYTITLIPVNDPPTLDIPSDFTATPGVDNVIDLRDYFDDEEKDYAQYGLEIRFANGTLITEGYEFDSPFVRFTIPPGVTLDMDDFTIRLIDGPHSDTQSVTVSTPAPLAAVVIQDATETASSTDTVSKQVGGQGIDGVEVTLSESQDTIEYLIERYDRAVDLAYTYNNQTITEGLTMLDGATINFLPGAVDIDISDINTTATIMLSYTEESLRTVGIDENTLIMLHFDGERWVDITTKRDSNANVIYGEADSFSPFALGSLGAAEAKKSGGSSDWKKKPTFGKSWEVTSAQLVKGGFSFNGHTLDITDNWHTDFAKTSSIIGKTNDVSIKTYASDGLKWVQLSLGVPEIGAKHNSETDIVVYFERNYTVPSTYDVSKIEYKENGKIEGSYWVWPNSAYDDSEMEQQKSLVDMNKTSATIDRVLCNSSHTEPQCYQIDIAFAVNAPLKYEVLAISALDEKRRLTTTYINHGIEFTGESLIPPNTHTIMDKKTSQAPTEIIELVQPDRRFNLWHDQYGNIWTQNDHGTWMYHTVINSSKIVPVCDDINDRICSSVFDERVEKHIGRMIELRDSMYGNIYNIEEFSSLDDPIFYESSVDSRTKFLIQNNMEWIRE